MLSWMPSARLSSRSYSARHKDLTHMPTIYCLLLVWLAAVGVHAVAMAARREPPEKLEERDDDDVDRQHVEILAVFNRSSEEIAVVKHLQWNGVYYTVASDAALVGATALKFKVVWMNGVLAGLVLTVGLLAMWFLWKCQGDLKKYRDRIDRCDARLSQVFRAVVGYPRSEKPVMMWPVWWVVVLSTAVSFGLIAVRGG